jgi:hypothetical protein
MVGNDNFPENIFCYRGSADSGNVDIGLREPEDSREVGEPGINAGYNYDFWGRVLAQSWIVIFRIVAIRFQGLIDNTHRFLLTVERCGQDRFLRCRSSDRIGCDAGITHQVLRQIKWTIGIGASF